MRSMILDEMMKDGIILNDIVQVVCLVGCIDPSIVFVWFVEWDGMN